VDEGRTRWPRTHLHERRPELPGELVALSPESTVLVLVDVIHGEDGCGPKCSEARRARKANDHADGIKKRSEGERGQG